ncbi:hypothetical protein [Methylocella sp.]|uniref:hypothetical protein n=1 Tax=Methylocella sp. TaxID=1978226 RepID=UPI0035B439BE
MSKRLIAAVVLGAALSCAAAGAQAKMMEVDVMKTQEVTFPDGTKGTVYVVKMNGHMMVALPDDKTPDVLRQQLFTVGK